MCLIHVSDLAPKDVESINEKLFNALVETVNKGLDPMNLDEGLDVTVKIRKIDNKIKVEVNFDTKKSAINPNHRKILSQLPILSGSYKTFTHDHLQCIADGEKIVYGAASQSESKEMKESVAEVNESNDEFEIDQSVDESLSEGEELLQDDSFLEEDEFTIPEDESEEEGDSLGSQLDDILKDD